MPVSSNNPAPYAPASAILDVIDRYRNRGLTKPFTPDVLGRAGVSSSLIPRTIQALASLDLIGDDGNPTETLENLRRVPEAEFKPQLAAWIRSAYADVMSFIDPGDDEVAIRDAFRSYNPVGQQARMVSLFMGLCRAADMRSDDSSTANARPRARKATTTTAGPASRTRPVVAPSAAAQGLPPAISGLLSSLPSDGEWTAGDRTNS